MKGSEAVWYARVMVLLGSGLLIIMAITGASDTGLIIACVTGIIIGLAVLVCSVIHSAIRDRTGSEETGDV